MSEESSKKRFADLNMTKDEMDRFTEAMKKEEFRKLLVEYAEELADPVNRQQYEKEIAQLEEERGMNVTFIHPEKGFCLKTTQGGSLKCFINICKNDKIDKPSSKTHVENKNGKPTQGLFWEIPHTCSPAREDTDHDKKKCVVYDVVFHPDSYRMGETNVRFKKLLTDSAMDTIEHSFGVKLDRVNAKILQKLEFKGRPTACVIKKKLDSFTSDHLSKDDPVKSLIDQIKEHALDKELGDRLDKNSKKKDNVINKQNTTKTNPQPIVEQAPVATHTVPKYSILHRGMPDMSDHANQLDSKFINSTRPKEIVVSIELPLLKSSQNVTLDVFETTLELSHEEPNYNLNLKLPFPVKETDARAKFDKSKRCLNVTLPVVAFVGKIESDYNFPLSCDSSNSNSLSSISDNVSSPINLEDPPVQSEPIKQLDLPIKQLDTPNKQAKKELLPSKCLVSETSSYLTFKFGVNNYVRDSIRIRIENDSSVSMTCEACSLTGCYITYYSAFVKLTSARIDHELISNSSRLINDFDELKTASLNFNDNDLFEIKLKKSPESDNKRASTAAISLKTDEASHRTIDVDFDSIDEDIERNLISENKVNNMTRKDYVINFKDIINGKNTENCESLDEDDDQEEPSKTDQNQNFKKLNSKTFTSNEKLKFEQRKNAKVTPTSLTQKKIPEEPELEHDTTTDYSDFEKDYLQSQIDSQYKEDVNEENDEAEDIDKNDQDRCSSVNSFSNDSSYLGSSLSSSLSSQLKGILKKPRSVSESESSFSNVFNRMPSKQHQLASSFEEPQNQSNSEDNLQGSKKSVHFNNQVVRNVFKSNSTVQGMKKPNSLKNKKKNQRKRTVSDPSHDYSSLQNGDGSNSQFNRCRSISESSDDNGNLMNSANSCESITEEANNLEAKKGKNSKKNRKKNKNKNKNGVNTSNESVETDLNNNNNNNNNDSTKEKVENVEKEKKMFDVETMLQWKNQGLLPDDENFNHGTEATMKFRNKIIDDLDD